MRDHIELDLTEAVEAAAMALAKESNVDWNIIEDISKLQFREVALVLLKAAAPLIVAQVFKDIASRTYDI